MATTRQTLGRLAAITSMAFAAAILTTAPAQARNVGGFGGVCTASPGTILGPHDSSGAGQGAYCLCVVEPASGQVVAGVNGPGTKCPPGVLGLQGRAG